MTSKDQMSQIADATSKVDAAQKTTEAKYPVGTILTAPNGDFEVVRINQSLVVLRNADGQEQGIMSAIIDKAIERGTMSVKA